MLGMVKKGKSEVVLKKDTHVATRQKKLTRAQRKVKAKEEVEKRSSLKGSFRLTKDAVLTIKKHWKILLGIVFVYLLLNIVFASGISSITTNIEEIKTGIEDAGVEEGSWNAAIVGFSALMATSGTSSSTVGSVLQVVLLVIESLIIIWALRHLLAGEKITVKQAYYNSTAPLVPFILVLLTMFVQLLPLLLGSVIVSSILSVIFVDGGFVSLLIFSIFFGAFAFWTFYMLCSSIFAMYIATLPEMQPLHALRTAKNLVKFRRWVIIRKLFFLPIIILVFLTGIIIPLIMFATVIVAPVFFIVSLLLLLFAHTYLYSLYRNLLE